MVAVCLVMNLGSQVLIDKDRKFVIEDSICTSA